MARVLYLDCFSGISGDMVLGALLDAGLPLAELTGALGSLALDRVEVRAERVLRAGVAATKFSVIGDDLGNEHHEHGDAHGRAQDHPHVHAQGHPHGHGDHAHGHADDHGHGAPGSAGAAAHHAHRSLAEIEALIDRSALSASGKARAKELFHRLAAAEADVHQMPIERVHLHEVGALDSIIDIVGAVFAFEWAGAERIVCSPLNVGGGTVHSAHGLFPVPAPATVKLLGDAPVYGGVVQKELVTPTGALIATAYASSFGPIPSMQVERVGYGAGDRDHPGNPNVLRVLIGQAAERGQTERVSVIECEIDDMNPQLFGTAMERLFAAGALDVFYVPVQMKKNRPGTLLTVVAAPALRSALVDIVFRETTTIGVRYAEVDRECLPREIVQVQTPFGPVRFKVARRNGRVVNAVPEFDDCTALAAVHNLPVKDVQAAAIRAFGAPASAAPSLEDRPA